MKKDKQLQIFTPSDLATYVVCPMAWWLNLNELGHRELTEHEHEVKRLKNEWSSTQALSSQLRYYAIIAFCLLLLVVVVLFAFELRQYYLETVPKGVSTAGINTETKFEKSWHYVEIPLEIFSLMLLVGSIILFWDLLDRRIRVLDKKGGFEEKVETIALRGDTKSESQKFHSIDLNLEGAPTAIIKQKGTIIPVLVKPTGNKVKDRHVIEIIAYLRLIEEKYKKTPPYGIIILGSEKRQIRIKNTPEKQRWLETILEEMKSVMDGVPALATPVYHKCRHCDVNAKCAVSAYKTT